MAGEIADNQSLYDELRRKYPVFYYDKFSVARESNRLILDFFFRIGDDYHFSPRHSIPLKSEYVDALPPDNVLAGLVFHIGMVELVSYWKAACPPKVIVSAMQLDENALSWWRKLYFNGLGEFFYLNGIKAVENDFMSLECRSNRKLSRFRFEGKKACIVPVGGGKDSAVTLELLKSKTEVFPLVINPRAASRDTIANAGIPIERCVFTERSIDATLLKMNNEGFLNGHTPFSALLAFESLLVAAIYRIPDVALSNESGANESTVPESHINHQYSKSIEFESDFRDYVEMNVADGFNYFSFLRPLEEIQIAALFSGLVNHHESFRSCNAGSKTDSWCGLCPKCLFTWIILAPFIEEKNLEKIFGKNLWKESTLIHDFEKLCGIQQVKPFECVGTREEVRLALDVVCMRKKYVNLPVLLLHYYQRKGALQPVSGRMHEILTVVSGRHYLSPFYHQILTQALAKLPDQRKSEDV